MTAFIDVGMGQWYCKKSETFEVFKMATGANAATIDSVTLSGANYVISGTYHATSLLNNEIDIWAVNGSNRVFLGSANEIIFAGTVQYSISIAASKIPSGTYSIEVFSSNNGSSPFPGGTPLATDAGVTLCFLEGTMIRTPQGEVAIENLQPGDLVSTADGRNAPVVWLGRQTVASRFADPVRKQPVRISAGALGDNVPSRDLLVSPDHALLVDGTMVHAGALVNGTSIVRQIVAAPIFTYYHVETDDHSLILAENTPAETYIDNVNRMRFDNWAEHEALYPHGKPIEEMPFPRAKSPRQVSVATRVRLAERGFAMSPRMPQVA